MVVRCEGINISGNFYRNKCELGPGRRSGETRPVWGSGFTDLESRPPPPTVVGEASPSSLAGSQK